MSTYLIISFILQNKHQKLSQWVLKFSQKLARKNEINSHLSVRKEMVIIQTEARNISFLVLKYTQEVTFIRTGSISLSFNTLIPWFCIFPSQNCDAKVRVKLEAILLWQLFSANMTGLKLLLILTPLANKKGNLWHFYREKKGG